MARAVAVLDGRHGRWIGGGHCVCLSDSSTETRYGGRSGVGGPSGSHSRPVVGFRRLWGCSHRLDIDWWIHVSVESVSSSTVSHPSSIWMCHSRSCFGMFVTDCWQCLQSMKVYPYFKKRSAGSSACPGGVEFISPTCNYTCMTDRLPRESPPLYPGHVSCNQEHRFGMNDDGEFILHDCNLNTTIILLSSDDLSHKTSIRFILKYKRMAIFKSFLIRLATSWWTNIPNAIYPFVINVCTHNQKLDYPYLQLHPDGVVILNWIDDETGEWNERM